MLTIFIKFVMKRAELIAGLILNIVKEVKLRIPDNRWGFFMELIKQLGFEVEEEIEIPEEHKAVVQERIKTAKPEDMVPWEEARKQFTFKEKL